MKLDQETIVKHQFWFLLGGYFLVWLIAVLCLKFIAPGKIEEFKKAYEGAASGVKSAQSSPVSPAFLPPWEKEAKDFNDHKSVIWGDAWNLQADMYDWPENWLNKYDMTNPQTQLSPDDRNEYRDKLYPNQIENLRTNAPKLINPVELKDGFDSVFQAMTKQDWRETPTREEIWLAQEDFWVKRELFWVVVDAMARQAFMRPVDIDEKKETMPKGVEARYRYRNKNWEITLNIRKNEKGYFVIGGDSTIKNIHPNRHPQPLTSAKGKGIWFNVAQDNVRTMFEVRGEPVSWSETKAFSAENYPEPLGGIKWDKEWLKEHPIVVSQGFDQSNCPIRRINAIELVKQDCRTFIWPLQQNNLLAQLDALPEDEKAVGSVPGEAAPGGVPGGGGAGVPDDKIRGMGMGASTAPVGNKTPNNEIERDRYLQPASQDKAQKPPSRHLPLAFQLVVEQSHMHDVLLSLANSRRFQITQVEFTHDREYMPQGEDDKDKKDGTNMTGPRVFRGGMPGMGGMGRNNADPEMRERMERAMRQHSQQGGNAQMSPRDMRKARQWQMQGGMMRGSPGPGGMGPNQSRPSFSYAPGSMRSGGPVTTPNGSDLKQTESTPQDDNLVELTIYGIATLYRAPDAPQTTEPTGQPGSPSPQPSQQSPAPATPGAAPPSATATPPSAPKQPDNAVDQQKAPPPPPPAGDKKN